MVRRVGCAVAAMGAAVVLAVTPAMAGAAPGDTVTATGTGQSRVLPANRHDNASISAAYNAARRAAIAGAISQAHATALAYAAAVGLTLGPITSVSDAQANGYYGPGQYFGPFGPDQFCGTVHQQIFKRVGNRRKVVGTRKVHRCFVPSTAYTTLTLTYAAS